MGAKSVKSVYSSVRVSESGTVKAESVSESGTPDYYNRLPDSVLFDPSLKPPCWGVYALMAGSTRQGNFASVGMRLIGEKLHLSTTTVSEAISLLAKAGHIQKTPREAGKRAGYLLTSSVFGKKQRSGVESLVSGPRGRLRMATVRVA